MPAFRVEVEYIRLPAYADVPLLSVRVYINTHREGHSFLIDPGLPRTVLQRRLVRLYGLEDRPEVADELAVYPSPYNAFDGRQANVRFETEAWERSDLPVEGVLGMNWFQRYTVVSLHMPADDQPFVELTP